MFACEREVEVGEQFLAERTLRAGDAQPDGAEYPVRDGEREVLEDGQVREDARLLERADQTAAGQARRVRPVHDGATEADHTAVRWQVARDQVEDGCLAGAVWADQAGDRALLDAERAVVDCNDSAEVLVCPVDLEECAHDAATSFVWVSRGVLRVRNRRPRSVSDGRMPRGSSRITMRKTLE